MENKLGTKKRGKGRTEARKQGRKKENVKYVDK